MRKILGLSYSTNSRVFFLTFPAPSMCSCEQDAEEEREKAKALARAIEAHREDREALVEAQAEIALSIGINSHDQRRGNVPFMNCMGGSGGEHLLCHNVYLPLACSCPRRESDSRPVFHVCYSRIPILNDKQSCVV